MNDNEHANLMINDKTSSCRILYYHGRDNITRDICHIIYVDENKEIFVVNNIINRYYNKSFTWVYYDFHKYNKKCKIVIFPLNSTLVDIHHIIILNKKVQSINYLDSDRKYIPRWKSYEKSYLKADRYANVRDVIASMIE
jgi:hypothetical protein